MLIIYLIMMTIFSYLSIKVINKKINLLIIYNLIWSVIVLLYQLRLIEYDPITPMFWFVIFMFGLTFNISYILGYKRHSKKYINIKPVNYDLNMKKRLKTLIILGITFSSISIIPNFINIIRTYSFSELMNSISSIYDDRVSGVEYLGYFSPIIYFSIIISGVYVSKYKFSIWVLLSVLLSIIFGISFGGRNVFMISLVLFLTSYTITNDNFKMAQFKWVFIIGLTFLIALNGINLQRSLNTTVSIYAKPVLVNIDLRFKGTYKIYSYLTSPMAVMNKYLQDPFYQFGANTFLPIYKQLSKVSNNIVILETLPFYNVPISSNVGSYITELIIDFSLLGGLFVNVIFAYVTSKYVYIAGKTNKLNAILIASILSVFLIMSFFIWYIRSINFWIAFIVGYLLIYLTKNIVFNFNRERMT